MIGCKDSSPASVGRHRVTALEYPFADPPAPGTTIEVAPGVHWLRMALPFQLDHINLWLLEDKDAWLLIDTGLGNEPTRALWERVFVDRIGSKPVRRVLVTHYHPDHAGNAAWLCARTGADLWMTRGEYLTVHAARHGAAGYSSEAQRDLFRANGLDQAQADALLKRGGLYKTLVPEFPFSHRRLFDGERIVIGGREWKILVGYGHAPEHASLHCESLNLLVSGDMLLPRISTNIAVRSIDPWSNPLRLFLESIGRYRGLPADVFVLPSHGLPFHGARARIAQLEAHHAERLAELEVACAASPSSAADVLELLFRRKLDTSQIFFAMGEAIAHLHYLQYDGRLARSVGADGVARFAAA
jgi:glyoxylase-like metal-dependent hydrolase (beta-lactamase superfamily II)